MKIFACHLLTFLFLSSVALAQDCNPSGYPAQPVGEYKHDAWVSGFEDGDKEFRHGGFVAVFEGKDDDPNTQNILGIPEWVAHEVRRYTEDGDFIYAAGFGRTRPWHEHTGLSFVLNQPGVLERKLDRSYSGEGHIRNRGHLATRSLVNRISPEVGCNTHYFLNGFPQYIKLNNGVWLALERYTGAAANKYGRAWAVKGLAFYEGEEIETVGNSCEAPIAIPHALFNVIIFEMDDSIFVRAFLFEQPSYRRVQANMANNGNKVPFMGFHQCDQTDQSVFDYSEYASSLEEIECLTGIEYFPGFEEGEKAQLNEYSERALRRIEEKYFASPCGEGN